MINRLIAVTLLLALISTNLSRFFIYTEFKVNQKYIAAALCENRDKPEMHCNGKCYLMKKLKQAEQKERNQNAADQKNHFQEAMIKEKPAFALFVRFIQPIEVTDIPFVLPMYTSSAFRPPRA